MSEDSRGLRFEVTSGVATITLDRPSAANTINLDLARELSDVALRCDEDASVRCVVITGSGRFFCAGGDLKSFASFGDRMPAHLKEVTQHLHVAIARFARMAPPVLAIVNGAAAGAGMSLVCAADLAIAARSARLTMAYTRAGLSPDGSATYHLARLVGLRRALELALTNRTLTADQALAWGLLNEVVPDDRLSERAEQLARELAGGATPALGAAKRLIRDGWAESLETQLETETRTLADTARLGDAHEGIAAFMQKREPRFGPN